MALQIRLCAVKLYAGEHPKQTERAKSAMALFGFLWETNSGPIWHGQYLSVSSTSLNKF